MKPNPKNRLVPQYVIRFLAHDGYRVKYHGPGFRQFFSIDKAEIFSDKKEAEAVLAMMQNENAARNKPVIIRYSPKEKDPKEVVVARRSGKNVTVEIAGHKFLLSRDEAHAAGDAILDVVQDIWNREPPFPVVTMTYDDYINKRVPWPANGNVNILKDGKVTITCRGQVKPLIK